jgi:hypothetical protein
MAISESEAPEAEREREGEWEWSRSPCFRDERDHYGQDGPWQMGRRHRQLLSVLCQFKLVAGHFSNTGTSQYMSAVLFNLWNVKPGLYHYRSVSLASRRLVWSGFRLLVLHLVGCWRRQIIRCPELHASTEGKWVQNAAAMRCRRRYWKALTLIACSTWTDYILQSIAAGRNARHAMQDDGRLRGVQKKQCSWQRSKLRLVLFHPYLLDATLLVISLSIDSLAYDTLWTAIVCWYIDEGCSGIVCDVKARKKISHSLKVNDEWNFHTSTVETYLDPITILLLYCHSR